MTNADLERRLDTTTNGSSRAPGCASAITRRPRWRSATWRLRAAQSALERAGLTRRRHRLLRRRNRHARLPLSGHRVPARRELGRSRQAGVRHRDRVQRLHLRPERRRRASSDPASSGACMIVGARSFRRSSIRRTAPPRCCSATAPERPSSKRAERTTLSGLRARRRRLESRIALHLGRRLAQTA